jgi:hypothetical protein
MGWIYSQFYRLGLEDVYSPHPKKDLTLINLQYYGL